MPQRIVALFRYQSARGVGSKDKNAADSNKVVSVSALNVANQVKSSAISLMITQNSAHPRFFLSVALFEQKTIASRQN